MNRILSQVEAASSTIGASVDTWMEAIGNVGFPIALLGILLGVLIQAMRWVAPRADRVINAHLQLVETATAELKQQTIIQTAIRDSIQAVGDTIAANEDRQRERHRELMDKGT